MPDQPIPVVLLIADISGYTRFMTANAGELVHAQSAITQLVEAIIAQVEVPLIVAKLEGDAVFLYASKNDSSRSWEETRAIISSKLFGFFEAFAAKVAALKLGGSCDCGACANIDKLRIKVVVHAGEALLHKVGRFEELAGVDVILVHRLLKNSVPGNEYVLLTAAAKEALAIDDVTLVEGVEKYDVAEVKTFVHFPPTAEAQRAEAIRIFSRKSVGARLREIAAFTARTYTDQYRLLFRRDDLHNVESERPGGLARFGYLLLNLVKLPLMLVAMPLMIVFRELRRRPAALDGEGATRA